MFELSIVVTHTPLLPQLELLTQLRVHQLPLQKYPERHCVLVAHGSSRFPFPHVLLVSRQMRSPQHSDVVKHACPELLHIGGGGGGSVHVPLLQVSPVQQSERASQL